jgi:hypothetical protein
MDDKIYDLLEKLYLEVQDIRERMATREELGQMRSQMATKEELGQIRDQMATKEQVQEIKEQVDAHTEILNEHTGILRALEHSSQVHKAEIYTASEIEGDIKTMRDDLTAVEYMTAKNWNDIIKLKSAI